MRKGERDEDRSEEGTEVGGREGVRDKGREKVGMFDEEREKGKVKRREGERVGG